jgi:hypothetical protein
MAEERNAQESRSAGRSSFGATAAPSASSVSPRSAPNTGVQSSRTDPAKPLYEDMAESLRAEQEHTAMLRKQLQDLQMEGPRMETGRRN